MCCGLPQMPPAEVSAVLLLSLLPLVAVVVVVVLAASEAAWGAVTTSSLPSADTCGCNRVAATTKPHRIRAVTFELALTPVSLSGASFRVRVSSRRRSDHSSGHIDSQHHLPAARSILLVSE